ncbi:hypothetical protein DSB34_22750 [Salmonella enterica subsp. enterica]|nr:hypothetical protein [Salmonella enterica subsp. enterica]EGY1541423.1 hypothetical protein [Salmonella enterica]EJU4495016.1 hypothetical protein [Salmonella enterica]EJV1145027.1 hypothetical protein [Salmonella enterica]
MSLKEKDRGCPEPAQFLNEVRHRTEGLVLSVRQMEVARWCRRAGHASQLREMCRDTVGFMVPPEEGRDGAWRQALWARVAAEYPDALKTLLSLSGGPVLRHQLEQGEMYAGAVLHSLLRRWLEQYGT